MQQNRYRAAPYLPGCRSRGFTVIEIIVILGVFGGILAAIWLGAEKVRQSQHVEKAVQETLIIARNMRTAYRGRDTIANSFIDLTTPAGTQMGVFPADMEMQSPACPLAYAPRCAISPWKTPVQIGANSGWNGSTAAPNAFEIVFEPVPEDCPAFMAAVVSAGARAGLVYASSTGTGGFMVTPEMTVADPHIIGCSGFVTFQFTL